MALQLKFLAGANVKAAHGKECDDNGDKDEVVHEFNLRATALDASNAIEDAMVTEIQVIKNEPEVVKNLLKPLVAPGWQPLSARAAILRVFYNGLLAIPAASSRNALRAWYHLLSHLRQKVVVGSSPAIRPGVLDYGI